MDRMQLDRPLNGPLNGRVHAHTERLASRGLDYLGLSFGYGDFF